LEFGISDQLTLDPAPASHRIFGLHYARTLLRVLLPAGCLFETTLYACRVSVSVSVGVGVSVLGLGLGLAYIHRFENEHRAQRTKRTDVAHCMTEESRVDDTIHGTRRAPCTDNQAHSGATKWLHK
jgi:hypothetical protein